MSFDNIPSSLSHGVYAANHQMYRLSKTPKHHTRKQAPMIAYSAILVMRMRYHTGAPASSKTTQGMDHLSDDASVASACAAMASVSYASLVAGDKSLGAKCCFYQVKKLCKNSNGKSSLGSCMGPGFAGMLSAGGRVGHG